MVYKIMFWFGLALAAILIVSNMAAAQGVAYLGVKNISIWQIMFITFVIGVVVGLGIPRVFNPKNKASSEEEDLYFN